MDISRFHFQQPEADAQCGDHSASSPVASWTPHKISILSFGNVLLPPSLQGPHPFTHPSPHVYGQEFFPIFGSRLSNWSLILRCAVYLPPCCMCFQGSLTCSSFLFHLTWPRSLQQTHVPLLNPSKGKKGKPGGPPYNFPCSLHRRTPCKRAWENGSSKFSSKAVFQQTLPKLVSWNSMS